MKMRLATSVLTLALFRVLGTLAALLVATGLLKSVGANAFGLYATIYSAGLLVFTVGFSGAVSLLPRWVAQSGEAALPGAYDVLIRFGSLVAVVCLASVALLVATAGAVDLIVEVALSLLVVSSSLLLSRGALAWFNGIGRPVRGTLLSVVTLPLVHFAIVLTLVDRLEMSPTATVVAGLGISSITVWLLSLVAGISQSKPTCTPIRWRPEWSTVARLNAVSLVAWSTSQADQLIVGVALGSTDAASYRIGAQSASLAGLASTSLVAALTPSLIAMNAGWSEVERSRRLVSAVSFLFVGALLPGALVFGKSVFELVDEVDAALAWGVSIVVLLGFVVPSLVGPVGTILSLNDRSAVVLRASGLGALIGLPVMVVLALSFGAVGAAVGRAVGLAAANVSMFVLYRRGMSRAAL